MNCSACGEELTEYNYSGYYLFDKNGEQIPVCDDCFLEDDSSDKEGTY